MSKNGKRPVSEYESSEDEDPEAESRKNIRSRKRLSVRRNSSAISSTAGGEPPKQKQNSESLRSVYETCLDLFHSNKITADNAFQIQFIDLMGEIIDMPDFDKKDMHGAGKLLEAGAKVYVCRVDKTKNSVMNLASTLNIQQKRKNNNDASNEMDPANADASMEQDPENKERVKRAKRRRKMKQNRFICEEPSKISLTAEEDSSMGGARRVYLKKKFNEFIENDYDFDYNTFVFDSKNSENTQAEAEEDSELLHVKFAVSDAICNVDELSNLDHVPFLLMKDYNVEEFDLWGFPFSVAEQIEEVSINSVGLPENTDPIPVGEQLEYAQPGPDDVPMDYGQDNFADADDEQVSFYNDDGPNEIGDEDDDKPKTDPHKVRNLEEFYKMYSKIRSKYGWCGPSFVRPHFNKLGNANQKKPKVKKDPVYLDFKSIDWQLAKNKYKTDKPERTVFDERTIERWSAGGRRIPPYIGIEDSEEDADDFKLFSEKKSALSENLIINRFRYFIDNRRNILVENLPTSKPEGYPDEFIKEEEDYIEDAGFDIEQHRDYFQDEGPGDDHDVDLPVMAENNVVFDASMGFPASLGGIWMESDRDPMSKATDVDSLQFTKKPKPIDMHALKRAILRFLEEKLQLQEDGEPIQDQETRSDLASLIKDVCLKVDKKMAEHLSISIIVVGLLHVVVEKKLFMLFNREDPTNPLIVCRGKLWNHADNIPMSDFEEPESTS